VPDTGEDREIKRRVNAKEAVRVSQAKKLIEKSKKDDATGQRRAKNEKRKNPGDR
jgi:hypothetical protein